MRGKDFIVHTASDPLAFDLEDYLERKGFIVLSLADAAMVMVVDTSKRKLTSSVRSFMDDRNITGLSRKAIKLAEVGREVSIDNKD